MKNTTNSVQFQMQVKARIYDWLATNVSALEDDLHPTKWNTETESWEDIPYDALDDWQLTRVEASKALLDALSKLKF